MSLVQRLVAVTGLLSVAAFAAATDKDDAVKAERDKLQGVWQATKWIDEDGEPAPAEEVRSFSIEFKGEEIIYRHSAKDSGQALKYRLDPSHKPKWIDEEGGPDLPVVEGIYKLDDDELTICIISGTRNCKAAPRPTEFKAKKLEKYTLFVLKKKK